MIRRYRSPASLLDERNETNVDELLCANATTALARSYVPHMIKNE